jgi:thiol:disulfide interchange protein
MNKLLTIVIALMVLNIFALLHTSPKKVTPPQTKEEFVVEEESEPKKLELEKVEEQVKPEPKVAKTYEEALIIAEKTKKNIVIFFSATWCGWCHKMEKETINSTEVKSKLDNFIFLKLDLDQNKKLASQFNVSGVPAYFIVTPQRETTSVGSGFKSPSDFITWLNPPTTTDLPEAFIGH